MKQMVLEKIKSFLDTYDTGYQVVITSKDTIFIEHNEKTVFLGMDENILNHNNIEFLIEKRLYQLIVDIELHKKRQDLERCLYEGHVPYDVVFQFKKFLDSIDFHTGISSDNLENLQKSYIKYNVNMYYLELLERKRLEKSYDIPSYIELVESIVKNSGLYPEIVFKYKLHEEYGFYPLGSAGGSKVTIHIGNIIHVFEHTPHPYECIEQYIEAVTIHELGHLDIKNTPYQRLRMDAYANMTKSIYNGNKQDFETYFIQFVWYTMKEEKRAWNEGEKFCLHDSVKANFQSYKIFGLRKYVPYLSNHKIEWVNKLHSHQV